MGTRGRASAAAVEIESIAAVTRLERPRAPHDLTDEEVEVWVDVVESLPADWFSPSTLPLLTQYCRHAVQARRLGQLIEKATGRKDLALPDYDRLLKMQQRESLALSTLATKMRISQQSTYDKSKKKPNQGAQKLIADF